ncbi:STAS domain-containing protein [Fulvivirgaceae bacterium BMA12]|uniref:Anti-sigma factor antagonist n=1 Tax=Agaribacillus aureus TaxID=3051825 RepID=A0ABT8LGJ5_9BACT|nr:STAS domain-containing protein [Fulvivirgaceae bacterium BMA12]
MNYNYHEKEGVLFMTFSGDLIGENNGPELLELISQQIENNVLLCAIDISNVRYINSSGIGVLITMLTKFRNKDGELVLINPSEHVKKLLIITKLNAIFHVADSEDDAINELKNT